MSCAMQPGQNFFACRISLDSAVEIPNDVQGCPLLPEMMVFRTAAARSGWAKCKSNGTSVLPLAITSGAPSHGWPGGMIDVNWRRCQRGLPNRATTRRPVRAIPEGGSPRRRFAPDTRNNRSERLPGFGDRKSRQLHGRSKERDNIADGVGSNKFLDLPPSALKAARMFAGRAGQISTASSVQTFGGWLRLAATEFSASLGR